MSHFLFQKLFVMKWRIFCFLLLCCACRKSVTYDQQFGKAKDMLEGKWRLIQYYRDNSDGMGQWVPVDTANVQTVQFTSDGKFMHNNNFAIQETIDRFQFINPHEILLLSSHAKDSVKYFYQQDDFDQLIFNPICTEFSCMRKFGRIQ